MRRTWLVPALALTLIGTTASAEEKHHPAPGGAAPAAEAPAPARPMMGMMPGGMMPGGMMQGGMGMMMHGPDKAAALLAPGRIEGRIAYLRAELAPAAPQETEFAGLAEALRAAEKPVQGAAAHQHGAAAPGGGNLAERLAAQETAAAARLQAVQAVRRAFTQLDAKLTPEQRKSATELLPLLFPNVL